MRRLAGAIFLTGGRCEFCLLAFGKYFKPSALRPVKYAEFWAITRDYFSPKTITQWFCGMLRNLRMSQFGVRFCIGGGANFMRRLAGRRKSAVAAGPIAERCQIFSFLFARRPLKSARLVRVFFVAVQVEIAREFQTPHSFRQAPSGLPRGRKTFNMPV